jgi:hypothetical protein
LGFPTGWSFTTQQALCFIFLLFPNFLF